MQKEGPQPRSAADASARRRLAAQGIELQFRGRGDELERMRRALRALRCGEPVRQLIIGEEGIGKSRLLAEALSSPELKGLVVYSGRAAELEVDRPFGVLSDALGLHSGAAEPERAAIGATIAGSRLGEHAEDRHQIAFRITELVKRLCQAVPVALVLEDMQWADRFSAITLIRLLHDCGERPLGIFISRRLLPRRAAIDDLLDRGKPPFDVVDLDGLDFEVIALLAHDLLGAAPGPRLYQLIGNAGGNPRLLAALIGGLRREGSLRLEGDAIESDTWTAPAAMRAAVIARAGRLGDRCQDLLTVAAVFERPFGVATLAAISHRSVIDVLTDLREALAARLLLEVAGVLTFRHELVRTIIYEETPVTVRAELHRQIGEVLRASAGSPEQISHHLLRAAELGSRASTGVWPADEREATTLRWELLTRAERDVAMLVARGLSNKQAGTHLQVSARTVETHLAHVFAKLGINSRVELAAALGRAGYGVANGRAPQAPRASDEADLIGEPQTGQPSRVLPPT